MVVVVVILVLVPFGSILLCYLDVYVHNHDVDVYCTHTIPGSCIWAFPPLCVFLFFVSFFLWRLCYWRLLVSEAFLLKSLVLGEERGDRDG